MSGPMISISNVSKRFGGVTAVDSVSLEIMQGEFFSLLGPSGCGKTTLLRMIGGFELPSDGTIAIDGIAMGFLGPHERPTNMVFQSYALFPHLTVEENIGYGLLNAKSSRSDNQQTVAQALDTIRLNGLGSRFPHQLSGGQRQRVALARALVCRPKVLLLDEPLGALDKALREDMQSELRALQKTVGITFVFVTHDQEEALALSDRIAVMSGGKLLQVGSPREVYDRPDSLRVAQFLGKANVLRCKVLQVSGSSTRVEVKGIGELRIDGNNTQKCVAGTSMHLILRPEQLALSARKPPAAFQSVQAKIMNRTFLGGLERTEVIAGGHGLVVESAPQKQSLTDFPDVWVSWRKGDGHLLL